MSQNSGSFYCFFSSGSFFLLTQGEKSTFSQLKAFISAWLSKKKKRIARKELVKRAVILGHVNWLNVFFFFERFDLRCIVDFST